jgi:hypothetical protein
MIETAIPSTLDAPIELMQPVVKSAETHPNTTNFKLV